MDDLHALSTPTGSGFRELPVQAAAAHLARFELVDVREADEFTGELGHVPGARLAPLGTIAAVAPTWPRDRAVLLLCRSGARSARAAAHLAAIGFGEVYNMTGGMLAWNAARLPIER